MKKARKKHTNLPYSNIVQCYKKPAKHNNNKTTKDKYGMDNSNKWKKVNKIKTVETNEK